MGGFFVPVEILCFVFGLNNVTVLCYNVPIKGAGLMEEQLISKKNYLKEHRFHTVSCIDGNEKI